MLKLLFSNGCQLPEGMEVKTIYPMIQYTGQVEISQKGLLKQIIEKNRNEYQEIMDGFVGTAPAEANAIIGVQVSTTSESFKDGSFLYVTYIGSPAIISEIDHS